MGYGFTCDVQSAEACQGEHPHDLPAFMGEVRETWFKTTQLGGHLADLGYSPGQTITFCGPCLLELLE